MDPQVGNRCDYIHKTAVDPYSERFASHGIKLEWIVGLCGLYGFEHSDGLVSEPWVTGHLRLYGVSDPVWVSSRFVTPVGMNDMTTVSNSIHRRRLAGVRLLSALTVFSWSLIAVAQPEMEPVERWQQIRSSLFGDRAVDNGADVLELETPYRALDAAVVPITIKSKLKQTPDSYIKELYLVIDNNPSPVAAVFHFSGKHDWDSLATRVRVNAYTDLRAIAERSDGKIFMVSNYVKASGGCSAPSLKDPAAAEAQLGKIKFRLPDKYDPGSLVPAQLLIKHPNSSGLQFDQISRQYIPADFVRTIKVTYNGEEVFSADTDISISEDPSIRFGFVPDDAGVLEVHVKDSTGRTFTRSVNLAGQHKG